MNTYGMDLMGRRRRRQHSAEFKAAVIEECLRPGVSIAAVALAHGLNANMLRKWVTDGEHKLVVSAPTPAPEPEAPQMPSPTFIPLALPAAAVDGEIQIELLNRYPRPDSAPVGQPLSDLLCDLLAYVAANIVCFDGKQEKAAASTCLFPLLANLSLFA